MTHLKKEKFISTWGFQRGIPVFEEFEKELDEYVKEQIDKEFNRRDCE